MEKVGENLNNRIQTDIIYTDFRKAFDSVDHRILLSKMSAMGFSNKLTNFMSSYLSKRQLYVSYEGVRSQIFYPTSGVPQGANLGPLLFIIFINDLVCQLGEDSLVFADDVKIFRSIRSQQDNIVLQESLNGLIRWCSANRIYLNTHKCAVMSISKSANVVLENYNMEDTVMKRVTTFRDLGITFSSDLGFGQHIANISKSAVETIGFVLRNCRNFSNIETLRSLRLIGKAKA